MEEQKEISRVIITGTRGALGSTITKTMTSSGIEVVGVDVGYTRGELVVSDAMKGLVEFGADLTDSAEVEEMFDAALSRGPVDAIVHCAGGFRWSKLADYSDENVSFLVQTNLVSSIWMVRRALEHMREQGFGRIVLISSHATLAPGVGESVYAATKGGLNMLVQSVAREVAGDDITINALLPSIIDTPANREEMPDGDFDTWVKREQLSDIITRFLLDRSGAPVNGALIPVTHRT